MKVRIKKTGQILNVEYDDDDLYKGWDGRAVWFYANEFDVIDEEETDTNPHFPLTAEEVEIVESALLFDLRDLKQRELICKEINEPRAQYYAELIEKINNLLTGIKQWQDENK